ncbi:hypothetical protein RF11_01978 [Thelohanellus kitauei]|uniref:Uncharacterized protein n=1 Tax=Thelohanellus kitauei TaxID=669202 RepID=A0A0C2N270_THEKT|nr:hypothetical protein RF11_01978 [Thelohanellus kitauei]
MLESPQFPVHLNEVMEMIGDFPPDTPTFLIEACCKFLREVIDHFNDEEMFSNGPPIPFDPIYKWLATVPETVSNLIEIERECNVESLQAIHSDFHVKVVLNSFSTM